MQKIITFTLLIFSILSLQAQLKRFTVEVPYPPKFKISDSIQSFTIMNRSMNSEFVNYDEKQLQLDFYRKNFDTNFILLDSTAADTTIKVLGELLFESQRFDIVIPVDRNIYRLQEFTNTPDPLDWDYVEAICEMYQTDALIVLENMAIRAVTNYKSGYGYDYDILGNRLKYHYASMDFYSRAHWRIYDPKVKVAVVDIIMNMDTIYWDNTDFEIIDLFKGLPTIKDATITTAIKLAFNFNDVIAPRWVSDTRYYYVMKNAAIDSAIQMAAEGNWAGALENWLQFADYGKRSEKSKIMLNIALGYEMVGDIERAIEWAKKSRKNYYREITNTYLTELLKRQVILNK